MQQLPAKLTPAGPSGCTAAAIAAAAAAACGAAAAAAGLAHPGLLRPMQFRLCSQRFGQHLQQVAGVVCIRVAPAVSDAPVNEPGRWGEGHSDSGYLLMHAQ